MQRLLVIALLVVACMLLLAGTVVADNGPHMGDFSATTDACSGCHRAHRGQAQKLLIDSSQTALCYSCHGSVGTGADTNVEDGVYLERDGTAESPAEGTADAGLRGGGFTNALMDTNVDGTTASVATTSRHEVGVAGTLWGSGAIGSGVGTNTTLQCGSCHNPHGISGGDTYRILRPRPTGSGAASDVVVNDEALIEYTIDYSGNNFRDASYLTDAASDWCAQCHTRYATTSLADSGDDIFAFRHKTNGFRQCLVCHVAHGTSASMASFSDAVEWPGGTAATSGANSRLLHVDNRGVCYQCHPTP